MSLQAEDSCARTWEPWVGHTWLPSGQVAHGSLSFHTHSFFFYLLEPYVTTPRVLAEALALIFSPQLQNLALPCPLGQRGPARPLPAVTARQVACRTGRQRLLGCPPTGCPSIHAPNLEFA